MRATSTRTATVLAAVLAALVLPAAAPARFPAAAGPDCGAVSPLAEPDWYAAECRPPGAAPPAPHGSGPLPPTPFAFAHDVGPLTDNVVRHRIVDFPGQTVLGANARLLFGYDFDGRAKTLYALDNTAHQLGRMNLTNGTFTPIGASVPLAGHTWSGLTFDPRTDKLFASSSNGTESALYTVDRKTGHATLVGTTDVAPVVIAISIDCAGTMYAHDISIDGIFTLDRKTAEPRYIGQTGFDGNFAQGMDFDNRTGKLYAYVYLGGGENRYGTVNLRRGTVTPLAANDPNGEFEGATQTRCPGPSTTITKRPGKRTKHRRAVFKFRSGYARASFECRVDGGRYRACSSPFAKTLRPGTHTFAVRAGDPVGNVDASPATYRWTIRR
jgi:hypothetical protein